MTRSSKNLEKKIQRPGQTNRHPTILGPVDKLEDHVPQDWWQRIFNSLYLKINGDVVEDPEITRREVDAFSSILSLKSTDAILDLCCGQGRHVLELARRGYKANGLDRSPYLIQKAKSTAKKEGLSIRFRQGDARKLPYAADSFDAVTMLGNSFGYLETEQDDARILKEISRVLKPWGQLLLDATDGKYVKSNFQPRSWEWIDKKRFVCRERSLSADGQRLITREVITDAGKGVIADQFCAERLYTEQDLVRIFSEAGFADIVTHGKIDTPSTRNHGLGMMEKRIMITGLVKKDWGHRKSQRRGRKKVAVVFGDPKKPDGNWCWDGYLAKMARFGGMSYAEMLHAILQAAEHGIEHAPTAAP